MRKRLAVWLPAMAMLGYPASPAAAETWIEVAHSDLGTMCIDQDTVRNGSDGTAYFRDNLFCLDSSEGVVFEIKVNCNQDFTRETITISQKVYSSHGNVKPDKPWADKDLYVSSLEGQATRHVCNK